MAIQPDKLVKIIISIILILIYSILEKMPAIDVLE